MNPRCSIKVSKDHLVFSAAHFISFDGHRCESLHGHNYRAEVEVEGPLSEADFYVFDFIALKARAKEITDELDHHMLLATKNPIILLEATPKRVRAAYKDKEWIFPREDCVLLPIENTTAELLAFYIGFRLEQSLREKHAFQPTRLRVEVEEGIGTSATCEWPGY